MIAHYAMAPLKTDKLQKRSLSMLRLNGRRHWASILLEREVRRGALPIKFMPPDATLRSTGKNTNERTKP
jgi:hypothetical protein